MLDEAGGGTLQKRKGVGEWEIGRVGEGENGRRGEWGILRKKWKNRDHYAEFRISWIFRFSSLERLSLACIRPNSRTKRLVCSRNLLQNLQTNR